MKTHYIYNRKTGAIVHIHVSAEGQDTSREGILHKMGTAANKSAFDFITEDGSPRQGAFSINVSKKMLVKAVAKSNTASGAAGVEYFDMPDYSNVKTTYKKK